LIFAYGHNNNVAANLMQCVCATALHRRIYGACHWQRWNDTPSGLQSSGVNFAGPV